ncbi:MAG: endonuclease domain-containing protein [Novosphingobium sp.]|jgi:very-short-patch-repair endonuclease|nr:endonuclease domain-containing protein [Novosphingobium sp.]
MTGPAPVPKRSPDSRETPARTDSPAPKGRGTPAGRLAELANHTRAMRRAPTEPEVRLWRVLSGAQTGGYKFRRQTMIGSTLADFLCPRKGLVVEVDGHRHTDAVADARRTARLEALGYTVLRVTGEDVMHDIDGVRRHLLDILDSLPDRPAPASPPPRARARP